MSNPLLRFSFYLLVGTALIMILHLLVLNAMEAPLFNNMITASYICNVLMAGGIYATLYFLRKKFRNQIGFLFMGGSFLKFAIFFIIFYPVYKEDGQISRMEFATFFVPYVACLIIETMGVKSFLQD